MEQPMSGPIRPLFLLSTVLTATLAFGLIAGPLDPPAGPIASTPKPLAEIEPRLAINANNTPGDADVSPSLFKITQPGSYYLTGNINVATAQSAIEIASSNVTLDLGGFAIIGGDVGINGVNVPDGMLRAVAIRNGTVSGFTASGVYAAFATSVSLRDLTVTACQVGARIGGNARIKDCTFVENAGAGMIMTADGTVESSVFNDNGTYGLSGQNGITVRGSTFNDNVDRGLSLLFNSLVVDCVAKNNESHGFWLQGGGVISNCQASSNTGAGIYLNGEGSAVNNTVHTNGRGIVAAGSASRIDSNHVTFNTTSGIQTLNADNIITRNTARGNGTNYNIPAGEYAQIITNPGSAFVATNPWANFAY
jgi:parallel beta-helix repeat protein